VTEPPNPSSQFYISQRLRLHYVVWSNPGKPPLILLHGGRDHSRNWDPLVAQLHRDWHIIAPDLRGHGDSQWASDGQYSMAAYIYDLTQLIHQQQLAPVTLIGHSLGGNIALRYTGIYPETVRRVVSIEGLGLSPKAQTERAKINIDERLRNWIEQQRDLAHRQPRRYPSLSEACARMLEANPHLSPELAQHLTEHGVAQNEDGSYSWKFDNYVRSWPPHDISQAEIEQLWARINCPTLLVYGQDSWASNPQKDGRARHFQNSQVALVENAGHWVHHDQPDRFLHLLQEFL